MMATLLGRGRPRGILGGVDRALGHLLSFEAAFVLFLYSNELQWIMPARLPVDETALFAAISLAGAAWVIWREGLYLRGLPVVAAGLLFIAWAVASAAWSPSRILVDKAVPYLLVFNVLCLVAGGLVIANRRERAVRFFALALGVAAVMAAVGLFIYAAYGDFRRWSGWQDAAGRVYLDFGHTVVNGAGTAFCVALFARLGSLRQAAGAALFAACTVFLLVGGGRGPFLGAALAAMVGLATRPPTAGRGRVELPYATAAAALLIAAGAAYVAYLLASGAMTTTLARFAKLADQAENTALVRGANRFDYWAAAYDYWLAAPLFGHGLSSFSVLFHGGREVEGTHPHNIFLQIAAETGIVGLALFGLFAWTALRNAPFRRLRRDPLLVCALLFVVTSMMAALFGKDIVGVRRFFFALSLLALRPPPRPRPPAAAAAEEDGAEEPPPAAAATLATAGRRR
jgi:O-antigen ligase